MLYSTLSYDSYEKKKKNLFIGSGKWINANKKQINK